MEANDYYFGDHMQGYGYDLDNIDPSEFDDQEQVYDRYAWFSGRILSDRSDINARAISWKRNKNGLTVTANREQTKSITVPGCGTSSLAYSGPNRRIVNGQNAALGQFPWIVLIEVNGYPFCGGAILNERWIVTAAHCFKDKKSVNELTIRTGTINTKQGVLYAVQKIIIHQKYNSDGFENSDIALIKTNSVIEGYKIGKVNLVNGICLPSIKLEEPQNNYLMIAGWGKTGEMRAPSRTLKYVKLDIIDLITCATKFKVPMEGYPNGYNIYRSQVCAYTPRKDACQGDSGGPAIEYQNGKAVLVGVVSFGIGCATDFPGVYTKISYFLEWISNNVD